MKTFCSASVLAFLAACATPPSPSGFGLIRQGFEESSNVATLREMLALAEEVRRYEIAVEAWKVKQKIR